MIETITADKYADLKKYVYTLIDEHNIRIVRMYIVDEKQHLNYTIIYDYYDEDALALSRKIYVSKKNFNIYLRKLEKLEKIENW